MAFMCLALITVLTCSAASPAAALTADGLALLALKTAVTSDPTDSLSGWSDTDETPCRWNGVNCSRNGRVNAVTLSGCALRGYIPSELSAVGELTSLNLSRNRFFGTIPASFSVLVNLTVLDLSHNSLTGGIPSELGNLTALKLLDLSHNALAGAIPQEIGNLSALQRLDLSSNSLNGSIPVDLAKLRELSGVLNLSSNKLTGKVPVEFGDLPVAVSLDLRWNQLSGEIPAVGSLLNQGPTAFEGNSGLCGFPLKNPCEDPEGRPKVPRATLNLTASPDVAAAITSPSAGGRVKTGVAVPLVATVAVVALISVVAIQWQLRRRRTAAEGCKKYASKIRKGDFSTEGENNKRGREVYVAVDENFTVELEDLLRASAYVVGKSRGGIVYRVVVGGSRGEALAVRRLSEGEEEEGEGENSAEEWRRRRGFESEAMAIGRARHPNVVRLRAYYYAPDERLLIYDYIPNGTLHSALHDGAFQQGGSGSAAALPWASRLSIVQGAARGLAFLHDCSPRKYIHGNIKTSKVLLDNELHPYISGFGLTRLIAGTSRKFLQSTSKKLKSGQLAAVSSNAAYLAPEARSANTTVTQKNDVYSFGVVLLEVLTGRLPGVRLENENVELEAFVRSAFKEERPLSEVVDPTLLHEVYAKKQVLAVFHIALGCTDPDPEMRPRMRAVSESLDRVGMPT